MSKIGSGLQNLSLELQGLNTIQEENDGATQSVQQTKPQCKASPPQKLPQVLSQLSILSKSQYMRDEQGSFKSNNSNYKPDFGLIRDGSDAELSENLSDDFQQLPPLLTLKMKLRGTQVQLFDELGRVKFLVACVAKLFENIERLTRNEKRVMAYVDHEALRNQSGRAKV